MREQPSFVLDHINDASYPINAQQLLQTLIPMFSKQDKPTEFLFLAWPPNLFAATSIIFQATGAYSRITNPTDWPPKNMPKWRRDVTSAAKSWRGKLNPSGKTQVFDCLLGEDLNRWEQLGAAVPEAVQTAWAFIREVMDDNEDKGNVQDLWRNDDTHKKLLKEILFVHAICDETCAGWGIRPLGNSGDTMAEVWAKALLAQFGTMATIHPDRCRVLPKRHTPKVGITLRGTASYLAFHRSSVIVNWEIEGPPLLTSRHQPKSERSAVVESERPAVDDRASKDRSISSLAVLLLPWPLRIAARDFQPMPRSASYSSSTKSWSEEHCEFKYEPAHELKYQLKTELPKVLKGAMEEVGRVDLAILPELALTYDELDALEDGLGKDVSAYITGVRAIGSDRRIEFQAKRLLRSWNSTGIEHRVAMQRLSEQHRDALQKGVQDKLELAEQFAKSYFAPDPQQRATGNSLVYGFRHPRSKNWIRGYQDKHHRWRLNEWQIKSYQLGATLHPAKYWWESIPIGRRHVSMINFGDELTICPMICEDLARQDPISDLIRAVGPSLVVALLMDGPQLKKRWSARYASVLADDPGSSVITLTSAGMVDRYSVPDDRHAQRVIALWSDPKGAVVEIPLEREASGVVLSLAVGTVRETTLDNRKEEDVGTFTPEFGGYHQIRV